MSSLDQDNFIIKGREAKEIDISKLKNTKALEGSRRNSIKVKKIRGINDELEEFTKDERFQRTPHQENSAASPPIRHRRRSKKKQNTWIKPVVIALGIVLLLLAYAIFSYYKYQSL